MTTLVLSGAALALLSCYSVAPIYGFKLWQAQNRKRHSNQKRIFLTFDDGPSEEYTGQLLDLLAKYHIRASFFTVASFAEAQPALLARMQWEGHLVGFHSLSHRNGLFLSPKETRRDFSDGMRIFNQLGVPVHFYRPPWGHFNIAGITQMKKRGLTPMLWDVMAEDWRSDSTPAGVAEKLLSRVQGGDIICLHDGRGADGAPGRTLEALKTALPALLRQGYQFDTVDHYEAKN